jgi:undecaprenyl-diphosphatase
MLKRIFHWIIGHELVTLILVGFVIACIWGFIELADEVMDGDSSAFDQWLLRALRNPADLADPIGPSWFEELARDVTALGSFALLVAFTAVTCGFLWLIKQPVTVLFVVIAIGSGMLVSTAMKTGFDRPRPELVAHHTRVYTKSFPSGHSAMSAMVFLTLAALVARVQQRTATKVYWVAVAFVLTALVGTSRVYLGVHWPSDVVAGWIFGTAWAAASWLAFRALEKRWQGRPPRNI